MGDDGTGRGRGRRQLLGITVIAFVSLFGAYGLYLLVRDGGVWSTTNQGEFVSPARRVNGADLLDADGTPPKTGVWWLLVVNAGPCDAGCAEALGQSRRLHALLNADADRLRRGYVSDTSLEPGLAAGFPRLTAFAASAPASWRRGLYVVDPMGNLVFYYRFEQAGRPVLDDLKRLLKVSQIG